MKNFRFATVLVLLFWGSVQAATVSIIPGSTYVNTGEQFSVDIVGSEFLDLRGGVIDLGMDGGLQVQSVTFNPYWDLVDTGFVQSSEVWSDIKFDTFFNPPVSGDFTIATVVFEALFPGSSTLSILGSSEFYSPFGAIAPDMLASQVSISAVPLPPAAWLFMVGLGWMFRLSKSSLTRSAKTTV
ncbi:MAG: cohesin domain-containing protein [Candidatus Thiodiazotropha sp. (ex Lucinoma borealis)]|nr:cohesin domain-containing protein [Candidatus Thiodiazotropha sp. (ex Lucinoma borealis)]